ncbi:MAG TPA: SRPBCC family protein [Spirochaetia bacterium]|nr:SRPBCC family protein [Spirochaetia bacterium]
MVVNIHTRGLAASPGDAAPLIDGLGSPEDRLWPLGQWPPLVLDLPLAVGAIGGHGPIRYVVEACEPGCHVRFRFTGPRGFLGTHAFRLKDTGAGTAQISHVIEMRIAGLAHITWPLVFRWLHDALIEDAFDRAAAYAESAPVVGRTWSLWVRMLRRLLRIHRHQKTADRT